MQQARHWIGTPTQRIAPGIEGVHPGSLLAQPLALWKRGLPVFYGFLQFRSTNEGVPLNVFFWAAQVAGRRMVSPLVASDWR